MSNLRQTIDGMLVRCFGVTFTQSQLVPPRSDVWDQLVYATRGVVTVRAENGTWVLPPHRAVWLPAKMPYGLEFSGQTALRMLYLPRAKHSAKSREFDRSKCAVVSVSPLLRELIVRTNGIGALEANVPHHRRLAGLIEDELDTLSSVPLQLPMPQSALAQRFADFFGSSGDEGIDITSALKHCGSSRRTMERLFQRETNMSLGQWVRRRKLLMGLQALHEGETVSDVAFKLGYNGPSAFIAMFKRELGATPGAYLSKRN